MIEHHYGLKKHQFLLIATQKESLQTKIEIQQLFGEFRKVVCRIHGYKLPRDNDGDLVTIR